MKTPRLLLTATAALLVLGIVASAWAAPGTDGGSGSGGAEVLPVLPVLPSSGGGSEPAPDASAQPGGTAGEPAQTVPGMPPLTGEPPAPAPQGTATLPDTDLVIPPQDEDPESPELLEPVGDASGGAFSFLATTGAELVSLITEGVTALTGGLSAFSDSSP